MIIFNHEQPATRNVEVDPELPVDTHKCTEQRSSLLPFHNSKLALHLDYDLGTAVTTRQAPSRKRPLRHERSGQHFEPVNIDHAVISDL